MSVVVLGTTGLLGSTLATHFNVQAVSHAKCDITDPVSIAAMFGQYHPTTVINCAGIVPKAVETAGIMQTFAVNALGPKLLQKACEEANARLIHISTDCIFSGTFGNYDEESIPNPPDIYGLSKYLGEVAEPHLTVRTSFIGLPDAGTRGLLAWAQKHDVLVGYDRVYWNGLTTLELGKIIFKKLIPEGTTGLVHLYGERVTKYELLLKAAEVFGWNKTIIRESDVDNIETKHAGDRTLASLYPQYQTDKSLIQQLYEMKIQNGL